MVHRDRRDDARERERDDVRRIEPSAEPDLEQERVGGMAREQQEAGRGLHLEHGDRGVAIRPLADRQRLGELVVGDEHPAAGAAEAETLVDPHEVRGGIDVHPRACRLEHRPHEGDGRALAVGAGHMDHRRQLALRVIERFEQRATCGRARDRSAWDGAPGAAPGSRRHGRLASGTGHGVRGQCEATRI